MELIPHLIDGRQEGKFQSFFPDRFARFEPRCAHGKVGLDLVPVLTVDNPTNTRRKMFDPANGEMTLT